MVVEPDCNAQAQCTGNGLPEKPITDSSFRSLHSAFVMLKLNALLVFEFALVIE